MNYEKKLLKLATKILMKKIDNEGLLNEDRHVNKLAETSHNMAQAMLSICGITPKENSGVGEEDAEQFHIVTVLALSQDFDRAVNFSDVTLLRIFKGGSLNHNGSKYYRANVSEVLLNTILDLLKAKGVFHLIV